MYPHQVDGIRWLRSTRRALLADDPGLGKTAQALLAAEEPVLVVSPAMLKGTWEDERAKWRPDLDVTWVSYSSLCQREGRKVLPVPKSEFRRAWGTIIFDEAHYLKNRKAKWTLAAFDLAWRAGRLFMLTGTPIPNWAHELYVPLRFLHEKEDREYTSYWRWVEKWFNWWTPPYGAPGHREITGLKQLYTWERFAVDNDLGTRMLRRRREDVLRDLPPLTEQTIELEMGPAQRKAYNDLKRDYCTWLEEQDKEVLAWNDGGLHVKLAQATSGLPMLAGEPGLKDSCKLEALRELLEERAGSPVVVFTHFRNSARCAVMLGQALGLETGLIMGGIEQHLRDAQVRMFQDGRLGMLVGTLNTLGEGVTLTRSATCVMMERSYRPSLNLQAIHRLHRIGQTAPVTIIYLVTAASSDQGMTALLAGKTDQQIAALTAAEFAAML